MLYVAVGFGGAIGALLRYALVTISGLSFAILVANIFGSFLMGALVGLQHNGTLTLSANVQAFVAVGMLGAFTTFSTFSLEAFIFFQNGQIKLAVAYLLGSVVLALIGFTLGYKLVGLF